MENTNRLKAIMQNQIPNGESVIFDFFITFSRLECALKNTKRFLHPHHAEAQWEKFAKIIAPSFNSDQTPGLRSAVDYIINNPPKKQVINAGILTWSDCILNGSFSTTGKLCVYIRRIRNNLLHGGKFNGNYNPDSRNFQLISYSTLILNQMIELDEEVKTNFLSDINP